MLNFFQKIYLILFKPKYFFQAIRQEKGYKLLVTYTIPFLLVCYPLLGFLLYRESSDNGGFILLFFLMLLAIPLMLFGSILFHYILVKPFGGKEPGFRTAQVFFYVFTVRWISIPITALLSLVHPLLGFISLLFTMIYSLILTAIGLHQLQELPYKKIIALESIILLISIVLEIIRG